MEKIRSINEQELDERPIGSLTLDLTQALTDVVRSEINLATTELRDATSQVGRGLIQATVFAGIAVLGFLPFLAFLVIGLGEVLDQRYWLSSLIVAVACIAIGGGLAYRAAKKISFRHLLLPHTRRQFQELTEVARGKAA